MAELFENEPVFFAPSISSKGNLMNDQIDVKLVSREPVAVVEVKDRDEAKKAPEAPKVEESKEVVNAQ